MKKRVVILMVRVFIVVILVCMISEESFTACSPHASVIGASVWKQADDILSAHGANTVIFQKDIPYTIPSPGTYALGESLTMTSSFPVITSNWNDVTIDLKGYTIASGGFSTAIAIGATDNTRIRNGVIFSFTSTAGSISLMGSSSVSIEDIVSFYNAVGVGVINASNVVIENCYFGNGTSVLINNSNNVAINDCQDLSGLGYSVSQASAITIENINKSWGNSFAIFSSVQKSIIRNCKFVITNAILTLNNSSYNQICDCTWQDVRVRNSMVITGTSIGNIFQNNVFNTFLHSIFSIGVGAVGTRIISCTALGGASGEPLIVNNGTNTQVYNSFLMNTIGPVFSGAAIGSIITGTNVANDTANYWQNLTL